MRRAASARYVYPTFPGGVVQALTLTFVTLTIVRGAGMLEDGAFFGGTLIAGGVLYWAAWASRRHLAVWVAHCLLFCAYFALGWHNLGRALADLKGWEVIVSAIGGMVWHGLLSRQMRPMPPHPGRDA